MFARMTLLEIDTVRTSTTEALALFMEHTLPQLHEAAGYRGVMVLTTEEGKGALLSLWDTAEQASVGNGAFYGDELARFATLFRAAPGRERYELAFTDLRVPIG